MADKTLFGANRVIIKTGIEVGTTDWVGDNGVETTPALQLSLLMMTAGATGAEALASDKWETLILPVEMAEALNRQLTEVLRRLKR